MRVFISADMEGVCGITHGAQCRPTHSDYSRFRKLLTEEVNAAAQGALAGGASEIVVNDSHYMMTNLLVEDLDPSVSLISGSNKLLAQMEGIDETFGCVFFVGYHEGDGEGDGVINHTLMSSTIRRVRLNGELVDEALINAAVAADFGVPVALVTGDDRVCEFVSTRIPTVESAPVKRPTDRLSAQHLPIQAARALIRERAETAVRNASGGLPHQKLARPVRFDVEFRSTSSANMCTLFPGVARTGPTSISIERPSAVEAYKFFWGLGIVGMAVQDGVFGSGI